MLSSQRLSFSLTPYLSPLLPSLSLSPIQETAFSTQQVQNLEGEVKSILSEQKNERKLLELSFLDARQDLRRSECLVGGGGLGREGREEGGEWREEGWRGESVHVILLLVYYRSHQYAVGDGAETETRSPSASQAAVTGGIPYAEAPDAFPPPNG